MERIDRNTWRTDNGDEVRAQGLTVTVEFGERTKAEVLCAVEAVRTENLQLRQRMDKLIRILNNDYDLCVQWDGLRKFWYVGLTDEGVRKRDERDAENAKLRACLGDGCADCAVGMGRYADSLCDPIKAENEKLRELVRDMWRDGMCNCDEQYTCAECCEYHYHERMKELGIEAEVGC